jgi:hypothetical protein
LLVTIPTLLHVQDICNEHIQVTFIYGVDIIYTHFAKQNMLFAIYIHIYSEVHDPTETYRKEIL